MSLLLLTGALTGCSAAGPTASDEVACQHSGGAWRSSLCETEGGGGGGGY